MIVLSDDRDIFPSGHWKWKPLGAMENPLLAVSFVEAWGTNIFEPRIDSECH